MTNKALDGIARLYGSAGLHRLQQAHVAVIGLGGVGSWAAEALARSGVGEITLMDLDDICVSNSNRQLHTLSSTIGQLKVDVMAERLQQINPQLKIHAIVDFIEPDNLQQYIVPQLDFVVDCIDSMTPKAALIAWCKRNKIGLVTTGGAGGLTDPGKITIADLNKTYHDPLAARLRSKLKREYGFTTKPKKNFGVPCVFSTEQPRYPAADGEICFNKSFAGDGAKLDCAGGLGAAVMVTATFGMFAASRAVERLIAG